jgi:hypothetical protein
MDCHHHRAATNACHTPAQLDDIECRLTIQARCWLVHEQYTYITHGYQQPLRLLSMVIAAGSKHTRICHKLDANTDTPLLTSR